MACPELEDLLSGASGNHAVHCEACRALLDACAEIDSVFDAAFARNSAPAGLAASVLYPRLSPIPEVLDLIGWAAVLAVAAIVLPRFTSLLSSIFTGLG